MATTQSVVFSMRNLGTRLNITTPIKIVRYSNSMIGGPDKAYLKAPRDADMWDLMKLLRCWVEIFGGDGRLNWWGYVNRISFPHGEQRIGIGMDEMFNYVTVEYGSGLAAATTAVAQNNISVAAYGRKEKKLFDPNATQAQAEQARDLYLKEHQFPRPEVEYSGGSDEVQLECYGWYKTLGWEYYTNTNTGDVENTAQIVDIVNNTQHFISSTIVENESGISTTEGRDGKRTKLDYINQLLSAGTTNVRPLLSVVDGNRYLHVRERTEEPTGVADYLLLPDGNISTPAGKIEEPEHCIAAAWVQVAGVPVQLAANANLPPFFIESAEYNAETDKTTYKPAGAYEQVRLAKYIAQTANPPGQSDYPPVVTTTTFAVDSFAYYTFHNGSISSYSNTGVIYSVEDNSTGAAVYMTMTVSQDGLYLVGCDIWDNGGSTTRCAWCLIWGVTETNLAGSSPYVAGTYDPSATEAAASAIGVSLFSAGDTLSFMGYGNYSTTTQSVPDQFHWFALKIA